MCKGLIVKDLFSASFPRYLVADLAQVLVSYLPEDSLLQLYKLVLPLIASLQPRPQKKAYQMLYHLTSSKEPACVGFVGRHVAEIAQSLVDSSSCVCGGSRRVGPDQTSNLWDQPDETDSNIYKTF